MAGDFGFTASYLDGLDRWANEIAETHERAVLVSAAQLHSMIVQRAEDLEGWSDLRDHIEVWAEDGLLVVGVQHEDFVSQAQFLEYGDEGSAPSPLFRTLAAETRLAEQTFGTELRAGRLGAESPIGVDRG